LLLLNKLQYFWLTFHIEYPYNYPEGKVPSWKAHTKITPTSTLLDCQDKSLRLTPENVYLLATWRPYWNQEECQVAVLMKVKAICNRTLNKVDHIDEKYNLAISTLVAGEMLL
jgi:hypothetical protein